MSSSDMSIWLPLDIAWAPVCVYMHDLLLFNDARRLWPLINLYMACIDLIHAAVHRWDTEICHIKASGATSALSAIQLQQMILQDTTLDNSLRLTASLSAFQHDGNSSGTRNPRYHKQPRLQPRCHPRTPLQVRASQPEFIIQHLLTSCSYLCDLGSYPDSQPSLPLLFKSDVLGYLARKFTVTPFHSDILPSPALRTRIRTRITLDVGPGRPDVRPNYTRTTRTCPDLSFRESATKVALGSCRLYSMRLRSK